MTNTSFISGRTVFLRALQDEDAGCLSAWLNDHDVTKFLFQGLAPKDADSVRAMWDVEKADPNTFVFAVCLTETGDFVGTTGIYGVNWVMRNGDFRVFIGDKTVWDRGVGRECARLMFYYGFEKLNLNKISLGVNAANGRAVRAYEKAGFVREGVLRQEQYRNFQYYDVIKMSMLREEYAAVRDNCQPEFRHEPA